MSTFRFLMLASTFGAGVILPEWKLRYCDSENTEGRDIRLGPAVMVLKARGA